MKASGRDKNMQLSKNIIYKLTITQDNQKTETYTSLPSTTFKAQLGTQKTPYENPKCKTDIPFKTY
jgi:hypothetical protein